MHKYLFLLICVAQAFATYSPGTLPGDSFRVALPGRLAYADGGIVGGLSFGSVSGWYPNARVSQIRISGGFYYLPHFLAGGGIEALGTTLSDSSSFSSARFNVFGRYIWILAQQHALYLGGIARLENTELTYISSQDANPSPNEIELQKLLLSPVLALDVGGTWVLNRYLSIPLGIQTGISKELDSRSEISMGLSLDLKSVSPVFFKSAGLSYLSLDVQAPLPGIEKGLQYLGSFTLGF